MRTALAAALAVLAAAPVAAVSPAPEAVPSGLLAQVLGKAGFVGTAVVDRPRFARTTVSVAAPAGSAARFDPAGAWRWASVTKQVVAVLVMQEVEKGRIDLDAPATRYLPGVTLAGGDAVTVRRLLTHTSGLFNPEDGDKDADGVPRVYLRDAATPVATAEAQCRQGSSRVAGKDFSYNNCDYVVAGALLEAVTGERLATLVATRIAAPLGLRSLRLLAPGDSDGVVAVDAKGATDVQLDPGRFGAAAGLAGTAADLVAFDRALLDGRLLGDAARATMWAGDPALGYAALGQWAYTVPVAGCAAPVMLVERRGQVGNVQVRNIVVPASGTVIAVFAATSVPDFGEPWQGKGLTHDLLKAVLCT